ncbi:hypothetical protein EQ500_00170 [Lactobacillus sp. XV13L]|nr:hypothetical protein [Lactobacillus sp. XV13L]
MKDTKTEQEKKKEQEKKEREELLKVVVPEAEWVTMPQEDFTAQPEYLQLFTDFYIAKFNQRDLEIMNTYDTSSNMVDINHYLLDNIHFSRQELVNHALQYHAHNFQSIVAEITAQDEIDAAKMTSYQDWDHWYEQQRNEISNSLS